MLYPGQPEALSPSPAAGTLHFTPPRVSHRDGPAQSLLPVVLPDDLPGLSAAAAAAVPLVARAAVCGHWHPDVGKKPVLNLCSPHTQHSVETEMISHKILAAKPQAQGDGLKLDPQCECEPDLFLLWVIWCTKSWVFWVCISCCIAENPSVNSSCLWGQRAPR